jgi:hypothetical protein
MTLTKSLRSFSYMYTGSIKDLSETLYQVNYRQLEKCVRFTCRSRVGANYVKLGMISLGPCAQQFSLRVNFSHLKLIRRWRPRNYFYGRLSVAGVVFSAEINGCYIYIAAPKSLSATFWCSRRINLDASTNFSAIFHSASLPPLLLLNERAPS